MLQLVDVEAIIARVKYRDWNFSALQVEGGCLLVVRFADEEGKEWSGRRWYVSRHSTESEVVQTCLEAVLTAEEHEARERFTYLGSAIYGPHFDVDALISLAGELDFRPPPPSSTAASVPGPDGWSADDGEGERAVRSRLPDARSHVQIAPGIEYEAPNEN